MAAPKDQHYPVELNPFGTDDEQEGSGGDVGQGLVAKKIVRAKKQQDDYPDYLSPFGDDDKQTESSPAVDDYDDSLNPFGDEETNETNRVTNDTGEGNPFDEDDEDQQQGEAANGVEEHTNLEAIAPKSCPSQPESLDPPPIPLPRTKSLLKKEQAQKNQHPNQQQPLATDSTQTTSLLSTTSSNSSSSLTTLNTTNATATGSFQRKKNKRNAPPVPINFKRQVSGSLEAIEEELNEIGDKLAIIVKEYSLCQEDLKTTHQVDLEAFATSRSKFIEIIKRRNAVVRRQKELMYRKRELKLDQIHSDIEYELRMIGNKQLSHRTAEDDTREKELLKKLVEIVEEKSDIVENINKDTSCDNEDIEEAFRRLNIASELNQTVYGPEKEDTNNSSDVPPKNGSCDKSILAKGTKLSKIATLLPRGGTIKGTMKLKRKRLFKKCDSHPIER